MTTRGIFGLLLAALLAGCAPQRVAPADASAECQRSGGVWRSATSSCEMQTGGGGAGGSM